MFEYGIVMCRNMNMELILLNLNLIASLSNKTVDADNTHNYIEAANTKLFISKIEELLTRKTSLIMTLQQIYHPLLHPLKLFLHRHSLLHPMA